MGRIKSTQIKKTAKQFAAANPAGFSEKFDNNKKILRDTMPSKSIRNKVAGYITRIIRMQRHPREIRAPVTEQTAENTQDIIA